MELIVLYGAKAAFYNSHATRNLFSCSRLYSAVTGRKLYLYMHRNVRLPDLNEAVCGFELGFVASSGLRRSVQRSDNAPAMTFQQ